MEFGGGSLLFVPQQNGAVDIFDVHRERLALRVGLPEHVPLTWDAMALDETGSKMFLISQSGITIAELSQVPLSLSTITPASGSPGAQLLLRGSGFENGATVTFGSVLTPATFVDDETLKVNVPSLPPGPIVIVVKNPDGRLYQFDAAFTVD